MIFIGKVMIRGLFPFNYVKKKTLYAKVYDLENILAADNCNMFDREMKVLVDTFPPLL